MIAVCQFDAAIYRTLSLAAVNSAANALTVQAFAALTGGDASRIRWLLHIHMERTVPIARSFVLECVLGNLTFPYASYESGGVTIPVLSAMNAFVPPGATVRARMTGVAPADGGVITVYAVSAILDLPQLGRPDVSNPSALQPI